ncbi:MAG: hypothetical protein HKL95_02440 [Phycisphaerae bacterium]|nr:hypothetical protein [Phycisphaerae bacterium]
MNDAHHSHQHQRQEHEKDHQHHGADVSGPYWKRIHRDWRFWIALLLMLGAMAAYLFSDDEVFRSAGTPQQPVPALGGS